RSSIRSAAIRTRKSIANEIHENRAASLMDTTHNDSEIAPSPEGAPSTRATITGRKTKTTDTRPRTHAIPWSIRARFFAFNTAKRAMNNIAAIAILGSGLIRVRTHKQDSHGCRDVIHLPLARR